MTYYLYFTPNGHSFTLLLDRVSIHYLRKEDFFNHKAEKERLIGNVTVT